MIQFQLLNPHFYRKDLGFIPEFLSEADPRPASIQLHHNYSHGGGWRPLAGWTLNPDDSIAYPGEPALMPLAKATLRDELILVYRYAWVAIIQPNRTFEVARLD
jgi:hypothetical protein